MKTLSSILLITMVAAAVGWTNASAWWNDDDDDYYYGRPWRGGPWYDGYPDYVWGGYPGYYGGSPVIRIITGPVTPDSDSGDAGVVH